MVATKNKLRFLIAGSYLISQVQKQVFLRELPHYSQKQCEELFDAILEFEEKGSVFVKAGFASEQGKKLAGNLKLEIKNLKKTSIHHVEKEERNDDLTSLENQITNL